MAYCINNYGHTIRIDNLDKLHQNAYKIYLRIGGKVTRNGDRIEMKWFFYPAKVAYIWIVSVIMQVLADLIFVSVFGRMVGGTSFNQYWNENVDEEWTVGIDMILSMASSIILTGTFFVYYHGLRERRTILDQSSSFYGIYWLWPQQYLIWYEIFIKSS